MKKNSLFIVIWVHLFLLSAPAFAEDAQLDCPARPQKVERQRDLAGAWFAQGQTFAKEKKLVEALDAFLCSMSMFEHESTLHNVKKSADQVEDKTLVVERLEAYVADAPEGPLTDKVQAMIDREKEKLATPKAEPEPEPVATEPSVSTESGTTDGFSWKIPAYVSFGVGGLALVQAIVFQSLAISKGNDADTAYLSDRERLEEANDIYQTQATWSFVVAGVVGGGGVLLYFYEDKLSKRKREPAPAASKSKVADVRLLPSLGGLSLSGTF